MHSERVDGSRVVPQASMQTMPPNHISSLVSGLAYPATGVRAIHPASVLTLYAFPT